MAMRSQTIRGGDKIVIYQKSVEDNGTVVRDKKVVGDLAKKAGQKAEQP